MSACSRFVRAVDGLNDRIGAVLRWLVLLMVAVGAYNALARWATRQAGVALSSNALNEAQWYLFSVVFLLGAAWALRRDAHVRVDVLYGRLADRGRAWIDLLGTLLLLLPFSLVMLWVSWPAVRNAWVIRETSPDPGGLPRYPLKALLLVGFALLVLQGLAEVVRAVGVLRAGPAARDGAVGPDAPEGGSPSNAVSR